MQYFSTIFLPLPGKTWGAGSGLAAEASEDLLNHHRSFETGDDLGGITTAVAGLDVDIDVEG